MKYIVKELWHGRSAREKHVKDVGRGMWRSVNELMLVRYGVAYDFIFRLAIFHFQATLYGYIFSLSCCFSLKYARFLNLFMVFLIFLFVLKCS